MTLIEVLREIYNDEYYDPEDRIIICTKHRLSETEKTKSPVIFKDAEAIVNAQAGELSVTEIIDYIFIHVSHQFNVKGYAGKWFFYIILDRESV